MVLKRFVLIDNKATKL